MTEAEVVAFVADLAGVAVVVASAESGAPEASWGEQRDVRSVVLRRRGAARPAALDTPFPDPLYGAQAWVSIINPSDRSAALARSLLVEAYERAVARHERRTRYT